MSAEIATQVKRPWRTTARSAFQAFVALCVLFPVLVEAAGLDPQAFPWLAIPLAVTAGVARVMALPQVEAFLGRFLPFLAAEPDAGRHARTEGGEIDLLRAVALVILLTIAFLLISAIL